MHDNTASGMLAPAGASPAAAFVKRSGTPKMGEAFGPNWGSDIEAIFRMPGGGAVAFDLSRLGDADYRMMRDHYQISSSLMTLTFMMHQLKWTVECDNKRTKMFVTDMLKSIWSELVRTMSTAFWAGRSPAILQWENDTSGRRTVLSKVKDLIPENVAVNWKSVDGWAPPGRPAPKIPVFDGLVDRWGSEVPVLNSFWYPLLMENGNYLGRRLLRPAFTSWYFSILVHLFANGYFERFGQPVPVARAPYGRSVTITDESGNPTERSSEEVMFSIVQNLRARGVVILPGDQDDEGKYEYTLEYLESQMRGADFERYLNRLDEEMSLALFTPVLMTRTADVGSYSLGETHSKTYARVLNALGSDWATYINKYIIARAVDFNFGVNASKAIFRFHPVGDDRLDMIKVLMQQVMSSGKVGLDLGEVGDIIGITLTELKEISKPDPEPPTPQDPQQLPAEAADALRGLVRHALAYRDWSPEAEYRQICKITGVTDGTASRNLAMFRSTLADSRNEEALLMALSKLGA